MRTLVFAALLSSLCLFPKGADASPIGILDDVVGPCGGWGKDAVVVADADEDENEDLVQLFPDACAALESVDHVSRVEDGWSATSFGTRKGFGGLGGGPPSFLQLGGFGGWSYSRAGRFGRPTLGAENQLSGPYSDPLGLSESDLFPSPAAASNNGGHNPVMEHSNGQSGSHRPTSPPAGTMPPHKQVVSVPEPSSTVLFALGLAALLFYRRSLL